jgi:hypothetical protein
MLQKLSVILGVTEGEIIAAITAAKQQKTA